MMMVDKKTDFISLLETVRNCSRCQRLYERTKVLSERNGSLDAKVLFVAEAPGRLGADSTGIPLYGDQTGRNFSTLLATVGWQRSDIFATNAVLCNPKDKEGNNAKPSAKEIQTCSQFLIRTIKIVSPKVVVTLGNKALEALSIIEPHSLELKQHVGQDIQWRGIRLVPLYHPSQRVCNTHRSIHQQKEDFKCLSALVDALDK